MGLALKLYEQLDTAEDDRARFRVLADAIAIVDERWPPPEEIARRGDVRDSGLRLLREIEVIRREGKEADPRPASDGRGAGSRRTTWLGRPFRLSCHVPREGRRYPEIGQHATTACYLVNSVVVSEPHLSRQIAAGDLSGNHMITDWAAKKPHTIILTRN